jgi:hypothetical protein
VAPSTVQSIVGISTWLTEYVPIGYETRYIIESLLRELFDFDICSHI